MAARKSKAAQANQDRNQDDLSDAERTEAGRVQAGNDAIEAQAAGFAAQAESMREEAYTEPKDNVVRGPDTRLPNDRPTWEPTAVPGETDRDPLGVGAVPHNFTADPTDNRAVGRSSSVGTTAPGEETSPTSVGRVPTATGTAAPGTVAAAPGAVVGAIEGRKITLLDGEDVQLTATHYIGNELFEAGAVLQGYTGPLSRNMIRLRDGARNRTARERAGMEPRFESVSR